MTKSSFEIHLLTDRPLVEDKSNIRHQDISFFGTTPKWNNEVGELIGGILNGPEICLHSSSFTVASVTYYLD